MNKKRIFSIIIIMVMVCAMAAAGCGKKEETTKNKDEPKQEETKKEEADKAEPEKAEEPSVTEDKDTNKTKLDDADIEALKASIAEAVVKEYIEPNKVKDFSWPASDAFAWTYFGQLLSNYTANHFMGVTEELDVGDLPVSPDKEIVDGIYTGFITWYESSGVENYNYFDDAMGILQPDVITSIDVAAAK